ncbi:hypothetical protein P7H06_13675 [Paenibacillus larvae]|nr:hypothetical protein [Paenibacillus larvae]MDT2242740.1 hypothetical protein [Paenibacillus larvae]MDT2260347.1 hypothetical protein [Paenibacillus larvae]
MTSILAIQHGFLPPTINFDIESQKFDLDFVPNEGRDGHLDYVLSNSFAFGGNNASILFRKYQDGKERRVEKPAKKLSSRASGPWQETPPTWRKSRNACFRGKAASLPLKNGKRNLPLA